MSLLLLSVVLELPHHRVHLNVEEAAHLIEEPEPGDVPPEFPLVQAALLPQAQPTHRPPSGEGARPIKAATPKPISQTIKRETDQKKIGQEYHDLANQFRKLYSEYQELHRRLQSLDTDRLAKERGSVDRLFQMQEKLEEWKAVLWKAAGETRHVGTREGTTSSGMVGVRG